MKKAISVILLFLLVLVSWFLISWYRFNYSSLLQQGPNVTVKVPRGSNITDLSTRLTEKKLIHHPRFFLMMVEFNDQSKKLKFGEYLIKSGMSAADLLSNVTRGTGLAHFNITFIEGWTFTRMRQLLNHHSHLIHKTENKTSEQVMLMLGVSHKHPEGLFFPDTYTFTWGVEDLEVLKRAYQKMQSFLTKQWEQRADGLPYKTAYEALIVASLIEKETAVPQERTRIAGVIVRRLRKGMRLQIDPTILYGLHKPYSSVITLRDLAKKTPYNTYKVNGLPPTPIDMPSAASIIAALHPAAGKALYYVARGDGSHVFSATYKEHLDAVKKYRATIKAIKEQEKQPEFLQSSQLIHSPVINITVYLLYRIYVGLVS